MNVTTLACASVVALSTATVPADLPTAGFRLEHVEIRKHLAHIDAMAGTLAGANAEEKRQAMAAIVRFLEEHIRKHAQWEEAHLYPAVDKRTLAGPNPFTASMRYEHRIVERWIDDLAAMNASTTSAAAFARATDRLLGLISAHFEEEEEVLLPILDRTMTKEQFETELGHHE